MRDVADSTSRTEIDSEHYSGSGAERLLTYWRFVVSVFAGVWQLFSFIWQDSDEFRRQTDDDPCQEARRQKTVFVSSAKARELGRKNVGWAFMLGWRRCSGWARNQLRRTRALNSSDAAVEIPIAVEGSLAILILADWSDACV